MEAEAADSAGPRVLLLLELLLTRLGDRFFGRGGIGGFEHCFCNDF